MSIDYYAVDTDDTERARQIVFDGHDADLGIDQEVLAQKILDAVPGFTRFEPDEGVEVDHIELSWEEDSYIQVTIGDAYVSVNHGSGKGDRQLEVLDAVLTLLGSEGLYIFDPQSDAMLMEY